MISSPTLQLIIEFPRPLATHYIDRSRKTGKTISEMVIEDVESYHAHMRYLENVHEKAHP